MAQTNINIRMDEELKKQFDAFCSEVGMSMTTAICVFAKTVVRQHRIPFEISKYGAFKEICCTDGKNRRYNSRDRSDC